MLSFYSKILVAYDSSELSKKALDMAITLAKQDDRIELEVVSVSNPPISMGSYGVYNEELLKSIKENVRDALKDIEGLIKELPNKTCMKIIEGNPGRAIIDEAKKTNADLIVVGSRGLSGLKEVLVGSTSHYVVQHAHCPVFVIK